jgi:DNA-binding NarL/FixJ family response regulator
VPGGGSEKAGTDSSAMRVFVVGQRSLQNELLCRVLETETGVPTRLLEEPSTFVPQKGYQQLLFMDAGKLAKRVLWELKQGHLTDEVLVALFNLKEGLGIEHEAIRWGVRGLFYERDSLDTLLKGVRLLLAGEIWLSRYTLFEAAKDGRNRRVASVQHEAGLTAREVEIVTLVASGADNRRIAEKLFVSENTVKTHLYNIFKKINVPNRLQAALWAANHLELD